MTEVDAMICRVCGREERASEGYPCDDCGDFICLICSFDGVSRCNPCAERAAAAPIQGESAGQEAPATNGTPEASPPTEDDSTADR